MNNITFKKSGKIDYNDISDVFNYYIKNSTAIAFIKPLSTQEIISYFNIESSITYAYCIYYKSAFCGFCLLRPYSVKDGYRYTYEITIYIKSGYTNMGIGTSAVSYLEKIAKQKGIKTIIAGICSENEASIKLFEKSSYIKCGYFKNMVHKFERILDNVYYQKLL